MSSRWPEDRIPNAPVRDAYLACGLTPSEVCRHLGWYRDTRGPNAPYTSKLARALGLSPSVTTKGGKRYWHTMTTIDREKAKAICVAIGVDFDEVYDMSLPETAPRGGRCRECGEQLVRRAADRLCGWCREEREMCRAEMESAA